MVCTVCGREMRRQGVLLGDAPGTVPQASVGRCASGYQRERRHAVRPPKPKHSPGTFAAMASTPEDMAKVARMVSARFPDEPELLSMLGLAA